MHRRVQKSRQYSSLLKRAGTVSTGFFLCSLVFGGQNPLLSSWAKGTPKPCFHQDLQCCRLHEQAVHHVARATVSGRGKSMAALHDSVSSWRGITVRSRSELSFLGPYFPDHSLVSTPSGITLGPPRSQVEEHKGSLDSWVRGVGARQSFLQRSFVGSAGGDAHAAAVPDNAGMRQKKIIHVGSNSCLSEEYAGGELDGKNSSSLCKGIKRYSLSVENQLSGEPRERFTTYRRKRQMTRPFEGNSNPQRQSEKCLRCSALTAATGLALLRASYDPKGKSKGQIVAGSDTGTCAAERGHIVSESDSDGGVLLEEGHVRLSKEGINHFGALRKLATKVLTRLFSSNNMKQSAEINEALNRRFGSIDALREQLKCVQVLHREKRQKKWDRFCRRFRRSTPLLRICSLYRDFLEGRLRAHDECRTQNVVDCSLKLKLPLMHPFLVDLKMPTESGAESSLQLPSLQHSSASEVGSVPRPSLVVGWKRHGFQFVLNALSCTGVSGDLDQRNSSCVFSRMLGCEKTRLGKRRHDRHSKTGCASAVKFKSSERQADKQRGALLLQQFFGTLEFDRIYAAGMGAHADGMFLHLATLMLDESSCTSSSWRRRMQKVLLPVAGRRVKVSQKRVHEEAMSRLFILAFVPTPKDCTVQHEQAAHDEQAPPSARHNCVTIINGMHVRRVLNKVATEFANDRVCSEEDLHRRITTGMGKFGAHSLETTIGRLKDNVRSTVLTVRRSTTVKTKLLDTFSKWNWLRKLLTALLTKILGLGSGSAVLAPSLRHLPMSCLEASIAQVRREVEANLMCSTGQEGLGNLMHDVLNKQLTKELAKAKTALAQGNVHSDSKDRIVLLQQLGQKSLRSTSSAQSADFLRSEKIRASSKDDCGASSCHKLSQQSLAFKGRAHRAQAVRVSAKSTDEAARKHLALKSPFGGTRGRSIVSSSFAEAEEDEDEDSKARASKSRTKKYIIAGAILGSLVLFSYAGPVVTVIVVVVGLVVGAVLCAIPLLRSRLRERAAATPRETDEESQSPVGSDATGDVD